MHYVPKNSSWDIAVYDINKGIAWKSINGKVDSIAIGIGYIGKAYRAEIHTVLGNRLKGPASFTGNEFNQDIAHMLCM